MFTGQDVRMILRQYLLSKIQAFEVKSFGLTHISWLFETESYVIKAGSQKHVLLTKKIIDFLYNILI